MVGDVSLPLGEVAAVRAEPRLVVGKRASYRVWDVAVETRDGRTHTVQLSRVVADEATWVAKRVAAAAGLG